MLRWSNVISVSSSRPAGFLQSGDSVQAGGAAGRSDQEEHLSVPGCLQGKPGQTRLQEEEGKTAAHGGPHHHRCIRVKGVVSNLQVMWDKL